MDVYTATKDDEDDDEVDNDEGVTAAELSGEFRQRGQVAFILNHSSTHLAWK